MKKFKTKMQDEAKKTRMTVSELRDVRSRVASYMEYHPLPEKERVQKAQNYLASQPFVLVKINTFYTRVAASAFAFIMIVGVPLVAERSVPGDVLYPVKVRFNEEVRSTLALSPYQKVEWETARLERRIAEARLLASEGKLTEEAETEVAEAVRAQSALVGEEIAALREDDAEEAAIAEIAFESRLQVQSAVLSGTESASSTNGTSVLAIKAAVEKAQVVADGQKGTTAPSYERLLGRVESETTRAFELLESIKEVASGEEVIDINRRLEDIGRKVSNARDVNAGDPEAAQELLQSALSGTQKIISFMTDIDVRASVSVEELVPVELTLEERLLQIEASLSRLDENQKAITARLEQVSDEALIEKVAFGIETIAELTIRATLARETDDITASESALEEATTLMGDLLLVTDQFALTPDIEETPTENATTSTEAVIEDVSVSTSTVADEERVNEDNKEPTASSTEEVG